MDAAKGMVQIGRNWYAFNRNGVMQKGFIDVNGKKYYFDPWALSMLAGDCYTVDGKDYFFIDQARFDEMVANNELLEHAVYVSNSYGTPRKYVEEQLAKGMNVILDIEIQGATQVHRNVPEAVTVFIIPPSAEELRRRLTNRGTETEATIEARLERARQECLEADFYDYIIINDDIDTAGRELSAIISSELCRFDRRKDVLRAFGE